MSSHKSRELRHTLDDSVSYFEQKLGVTEKERLLLQLYVSESPNPAETVRLFSMVRYEEESYSFNYMLSRLCARHGFQLAPAALRPRIRGCYRQIAVENIRRLSMLIQLAGQLESRSIPVLVVKGGALRLGPLAKIPRQMGDVDLVVPKARFEEARQTALKFGFTVEYDVLHSADLFWEGRHCLDLHYTLFKQNIWEPESEPIWSRAETITKNGIHLLLPPLEEQFLHLLVNAFDNMISNDCRKGAVSWAADCFDLLRLHPELSLKRVAALAKEYGVRSELSIAAVLLNRLIPGHFQELLQADGSRFDQRLCSRLRRYDYYISVPYEEICTYPLLKRIFFRIGYTYSCNAGSFYLISKSFWTCLRHYPAFLKTYWEIDSFWSLPAKMKKKMSEREKRKSCEGTTE